MRLSYLAILFGVFGILSPLIGITLFSVFPNLLPEQTEYLVISAAMKFMNPFLAALFITALTSALVSTSDSSILAGASIVTEPKTFCPPKTFYESCRAFFCSGTR